MKCEVCDRLLTPNEEHYYIDTCEECERFNMKYGRYPEPPGQECLNAFDETYFFKGLEFVDGRFQSKDDPAEEARINYLWDAWKRCWIHHHLDADRREVEKEAGQLYLGDYSLDDLKNWPAPLSKEYAKCRRCEVPLTPEENSAYEGLCSNCVGDWMDEIEKEREEEARIQTIGSSMSDPHVHLEVLGDYTDIVEEISEKAREEEMKVQEVVLFAESGEPLKWWTMDCPVCGKLIKSDWPVFGACPHCGAAGFFVAVNVEITGWGLWMMDFESLTDYSGVSVEC